MIVLLMGSLGEGKSALSVLVMKLLSEHGIKTHSNFTCDYAESPNPLKIEDFIRLKHDDYRVVILDEPYAWGLESRRSSADLTIAMTIRIMQSRHYNEDILIVTQLPSMIDKRVREIRKTLISALPQTEDNFRYLIIDKGKSVFTIPKEIYEEFVFNHYNTKEIISDDLVFDDNTLNMFRENEKGDIEL